MLRKINLMCNIDGDWIGLYIDDELIDEGHSLSEWNMIEIFIRNLNGEKFYFDKSIEMDLCDTGRCPFYFDKWDKSS